MREREALVCAALGEKGAGGGEKYVAWYNGAVGAHLNLKAAWCAIFVSWCARQAGIGLPQLPNFASCTAGRNRFRQMGIWKERSSGYAPRRGDLILFDWDADPSLAEHVGIVTGVDKSYVYTVEGNSGNTVREKRYSRNSSCVLGYASWKEKEEWEMTKEEAQALMEQKVAEAKRYADSRDQAVMAQTKEYVRKACTQTVYHTVEEVPQWARETVKDLVACGALRGDGKGDLALSEEMLRLLVIMERAAWV